MNSREFMQGLLSNYPAALHPTEQAQRDMMRILAAWQYASEQLDSLYDEALRSCQYFPKISDLSDCALRLGLSTIPAAKRDNQLGRTKEMFLNYEGHKDDSVSFREWLAQGGLEEIRRQCHYDQEKINKRIQLLGAFEYITPERKPIADYDDSPQEGSDWETI